MGNTRKGSRLAGDLVVSSGANCHPRCRPCGIDRDPVFCRDVISRRPQATSRHSCRLSPVDPCLARLVRGCAAHHRQPDHLHTHPRHRLSLGLSPGRPTRCDLVRLYVGRVCSSGVGPCSVAGSGPFGALQELVNNAARLASDSAALQFRISAARPPDRSEVPAFPWTRGRIVPLMGLGHDGN